MIYFLCDPCSTFLSLFSFIFIRLLLILLCNLCNKLSSLSISLDAFWELYILLESPQQSIQDNPGVGLVFYFISIIGLLALFPSLSGSNLGLHIASLIYNSLTAYSISIYDLWKKFATIYSHFLLTLY